MGLCRSLGRGFFRSLKLGCGGFRRMSILSSPPPPPWLMLPCRQKYKFYNVAENKLISFKYRRSSRVLGNRLEIKGSSHGWLCLYNDRNCDVFLANPISGRDIKLPHIQSLPIPDENLKGGYGCVTKVILSGCPDEEGEKCRAMMMYGPADNLAFCCPGSSREWTCVNPGRFYEDFVYSSRHRRFLCLQDLDYDVLEAWDLSDPAYSRLEWSDEELIPRCYLPWYDRVQEAELETGTFTRLLRCLVVAEHGQLYLVTRHVVQQMARDGSVLEDLRRDDYPHKTIDFSVHKVDRERGRLTYMEDSLDGLAMFVGLNNSFAVSGSSELKPNSIYFTNHMVMCSEYDDGLQSHGGHDIGIFDYENKTISPCYYPCDIRSFRRIEPAPIWFTPLF